jgi:hypothetical protein
LSTIEGARLQIGDKIKVSSKVSRECAKVRFQRGYLRVIVIEVSLYGIDAVGLGIHCIDFDKVIVLVNVNNIVDVGTPGVIATG